MTSPDRAAERASARPLNCAIAAGMAFGLLAGCGAPSGMTPPPLLNTQQISAVAATVERGDGRGGMPLDALPEGATASTTPQGTGMAALDARASGLRARAAALRRAEPAEAQPRADLRRRAEASRAEDLDAEHLDDDDAPAGTAPD
ncbi:MAG: hypothetical protein JJU19_12610 [Pararhodobacter sp.]|nr:hypothetical protein [Pararhodobacter sp.]